MAQLINIRKHVRFDNTFPPGGSTQGVDELGRINQIVVNYDSVKVQYDATYIGTSTNIQTYTRTISDQTV